MSTSGNSCGGAAGYATVATHLLFSVIKIMIKIMFNNTFSIGSHMHISDVTNMSLIIFWIKECLNSPKFLTKFAHICPEV